MNCGKTILQHGAGAIFLLVMASRIAVANTASEAIQALQSQRGIAATKAICEIRGERGAPQPENWILLLNDPTSHSGVREIVMSQRKITSDRTPIAEYSGVGEMPTLNPDTLKCDSNKAFQIANYQAIKQGVGFHSVDYRLNRGEKGGAVWKIHLFDYLGTSVGNILISAETGLVLQPLKLHTNLASSSRSHRPESYEEWVEGGGFIGHLQTATQHTIHATKKTVNKTVKSTEKAAKKTQESVLRVMGNTQEWWTGKRTIGPESK